MHKMLRPSLQTFEIQAHASDVPAQTRNSLKLMADCFVPLGGWNIGLVTYCNYNNSTALREHETRSEVGRGSTWRSRRSKPKDSLAEENACAQATCHSFLYNPEMAEIASLMQSQQRLSTLYSSRPGPNRKSPPPPPPPPFRKCSHRA